MTTYTKGYILIAKRDILKKDIISMCNLLNSHDKYINICKFTPERITESGIVYKYLNNEVNNNFYKSVRLRGIKWCFINDNVIIDWEKSNDIILKQNNKINTFLRSFNGASLFTIDELKIWEELFNKIGLKRFGKYPSEKKLIHHHCSLLMN